MLRMKSLQTILFFCTLAFGGMALLLSGILRENTGKTDTGPDITVKTLAEGKKTIPIYYRYGETWNTNIKLPVIVITYEGEGHASITGLDVIGRTKNREVCRNRFYKEDIDERIEDTNVLLNRLTSDPGNPWKVYNLKKIFGVVDIPKNGFKTENRLKKNEKIAMDLSPVYHFLYEGSAKVDEIIFQFKVDSNGKETMWDFPVALTPYTCRGSYIFPIRGSATISAMPLNEANGHRGLPSSEFAFDIIDVRRLSGGELSSSSPHRSDNVKNYFIFERDVLAVGDGGVVAIGNGWPNKWMENPLRYSEKRISSLTEDLIKKGVKFENAYIGNYIIIDHQNGEFSAYVHLSENSIMVKPGDKVEQGQVIAKVGNTANSTEPHLHFQLMDGKDYAAANGLPVMFKDLPTPLEPAHDFAEVNTLIYSDYLFAFSK